MEAVQREKWAILRDDGKLFAPWGLTEYEKPKGKRPGKWMKVEGKLEMCRKGFHVTTADLLPGWRDYTAHNLRWGAESWGHQRLDQSLWKGHTSKMVRLVVEVRGEHLHARGYPYDKECWQQMRIISIHEE